MERDRRVVQPGPALGPRAVVVPCRARRVVARLPVGVVLLDGLAAVLGVCSGAVVHLSGGGFGPFDYVMPALSATAAHAAFYSDVVSPAGVSRMVAARVTFGTREGRPWLHCHGFWQEADGRLRGGHVIPDRAVVAEAIDVEAWVLDGAGFMARHDPETNFTLFGPEAAAPTGAGSGAFLAVRLRPNQEIGEALEAICAAHGFAAARVRGGVASLIGAVFADGREMAAFATEVFVRDGVVGAATALDIGLVNYLGQIGEGLLLRQANPVLMTAELVLECYSASAWPMA